MTMTSTEASGHQEKLSALIPAEEIGAIAIQRDDPVCDGRGIRIAVFDTGVDPAALHLQTTTEGLPKIVDIVDTTGSGDVDMKKVVKPGADGEITTLTDRKFKIPASWTCPSGEFRVGIKVAYEVFPGALLRRLKKKRKEDWEKRARRVVAAVEEQLCTAKAADPTDEKRVGELEARVAVLKEHVANYEDQGPVLDCIAFHDGKLWRAVVVDDSLESLDQATPMADYSHNQEYGRFSDEDQLSYSFKFHNDGDILSIVTTSGSHGTHVAGILAAHDPDSPERNGLAPGAQLVAVKIGDGRLDAMETAAGIARGVTAAVDNGCHLINMSFGESSAVPNAGIVVKALQEAVREKNVLFIGSASNSGPGLSTMGCPGGLSSALLGIGAYASKALMASSYALPHGVPDALFSWSSRGPTPDGDTGVCVSAPGGAITEVPAFNLQGTKLMNGTSMACPNLCGGLAVLLSALKKRGISWSPFSVRKALENTAKPLPGCMTLDTGHGVAQLHAALELLTDHRNDPTFLPEYSVRASYFAMSGRGIYLRDSGHFEQGRVESVVSVTPRFHRDTPKDVLIGFECPVSLVCDKSWVSVADFLLLNTGTRSFPVHVHTSGLSPGLHYTEVRGYRVGAAQAGPVFRIPVTVCKPEQLSLPGTSHQFAAVLDAGSVQRKFYSVPPGVSGCVLTVTGGSFEGSRRMIMHAVQLAHQKTFDTTELHRYFGLREHETTRFELAVQPGRGLEVCLAQWWAAAGACDVTVTVDFVGLNLSGSRTLYAGSVGGVGRLDATCTLGKVSLQPKMQYTSVQRVVFPGCAGTIRVLKDARNTRLDGGQMFALDLSYAFSLADKSNVYPLFPGLSDFLYEADMENQLWMVFDENKRIVQQGDAFPWRYKKDLSKGSYTIMYQLRHHDKARLQALKEAHIYIVQKLKSPVSAGVAGVQPGTTARTSFGKRDLVRGRTVPLFVEPPKTSKLPKDVAHGDVLAGTLSMVADAKWAEWPIEFVVAKGKVKPAEGSGNGGKKKKDAKKSRAELRKAADLDFVKSAGKDDVEAVAAVGDEYPEDVSAQLAVLSKRFELAHDKAGLLPLLEQAVQLIDEQALAEFFGRTDVHVDENKESKEAAAKRKEDMTTTKSNLLALLLMMLKCSLELDGSTRAETSKGVVAHARRWTDPYKESKWAIPLAKYHMALDEYGRAMQCIAQENSKEAFKLELELAEKLGWSDLVNPRLVHLVYPASYPLFVE